MDRVCLLYRGGFSCTEGSCRLVGRWAPRAGHGEPIAQRQWFALSAPIAFAVPHCVRFIRFPSNINDVELCRWRLWPCHVSALECYYNYQRHNRPTGVVRCWPHGAAGRTSKKIPGGKSIRVIKERWVVGHCARRERRKDNNDMNFKIRKADPRVASVEK